MARWKYGKRFGGSSSLLTRIGRWPLAALAFGYIYLTAVYLTLPDVRPLAAEAPETTAFIELRGREARREARPIERVQRWVRYDDISPNLKRAVLTAEDSAFFDHDGFDYDELQKSMEMWKRGDFSRGASTITQQLAKNLYLSPSRNPVRKFRELLITRLLEGALTKRRILELYLNVVEWGDGVYGADAAARTYFRVPASGLSAEQAALLAGSLINPRRYSPGSPPRRLRQRQAIILRRMRAGGGLTASGPRSSPTRATAPIEAAPAELETLDEDPETTPDDADSEPPDSTEPAAPPPPTKDPS
ncbi:MAG: monofunctional biosynthetic peptidoglycan transglycosylase [Vicinamibacteraceae bacterium]